MNNRIVILALALCAPAFAGDVPAKLAERVDVTGARKDIRQTRERFIKEALQDSEKPLIRRSMTLADLLADPQVSTKYDEKPAHQNHLNDEEWERFALSLGDANANGTLAIRLPRMAAVYRFTGDEKLLAETLAQLKEMAGWAPLERPGAVSTKANVSPAPWLGSGWGVRAVTETLSILPKDKVPSDLRAALVSLLESEIRDVRTAWKEKRLWYTKEESAYSNQWMVPMEGLLRASVFLGKEKHADDYEFAVKSLLRSLDMQGKEGEFAEGFSYAALTMSSVLSSADAAASTGDRRLADHPYLRKFPVWYANHLQPGGGMINAFDSKSEELDPHLLSRLVVVTGSPEARWMADRMFKGRYGHTLNGLVAQWASNGIEPREPALWANYEMAPRINWRENWDDETSAGFWMRGGHESDSHDHMDRGHVSFSIGRKKLLIEAGLLSYGVPQHPTHYKSVAGHNVLQVGPAKPEELKSGVLKKSGQILNPSHRSAPITVKRMDENGGEASVDASGCYDATKKWVRDVSWDKNGVDERDEVELKKADTVTFRWHLGVPADSPAQISGGEVKAGGIRVSLDSPEPIDISVEPMPGYDSDLKNETMHACVVVRSKSPVEKFSLRTKVRLAE